MEGIALLSTGDERISDPMVPILCGVRAGMAFGLRESVGEW